MHYAETEWRDDPERGGSAEAYYMGHVPLTVLAHLGIKSTYAWIFTPHEPSVIEWPDEALSRKYGVEPQAMGVSASVLAFIEMVASPS